MARKKAETKAEKEARLATVSRMYLRGRYQHEIAAATGVTQQQISYDLKTLMDRWKESGIRDLDAYKNEQLQKIDELERESWEEWYRSKNEREISVTEKFTSEPGVVAADGQVVRDTGAKNKPEMKTRAQLRREGQTGNTSYTATIQWCIEQRCKILGLEAPRRTELSGPDGAPVNIQASVSVDSRQMILHLQEQLKNATPEERTALIDAQEMLMTAVQRLSPVVLPGVASAITQIGDGKGGAK